MKLSEKIMYLRKQNGWSQEELGMQLGISRQSVSKWESGMSVPDLDKIMKLSDLFHVTTDYLLKEQIEMEKSPDLDEAEGPVVREISQSEAEAFMDVTARLAKRIAAGVVLCILSPVVLILLTEMAEAGMLPLSENVASAIGVGVLFLMICPAVAIFIWNGMRLNQYEYMEKEILYVPEQLRERIRQRKEDFAGVLRMCIAIGVVLCIAGVVPMGIVSELSLPEIVEIFCLVFLFGTVSCAVFLFVWCGMVNGSYEKLLQARDYSKEIKRRKQKAERFSQTYWYFVTAVYLGLSFWTNHWHRTWIIWPCAGAFYGVFSSLFGSGDKKRR